MTINKALTVVCPVCSAPVGKVCLTPQGVKVTVSHQRRHRVASGQYAVVPLHLTRMELEPLLWLVKSEYRHRGSFGRIVRALEQAISEENDKAAMEAEPVMEFRGRFPHPSNVVPIIDRRKS